MRFGFNFNGNSAYVADFGSLIFFSVANTATTIDSLQESFPIPHGNNFSFNDYCRFLEEHDDYKIIKERKNEPADSLDEVISNFKKDGLL